MSTGSEPTTDSPHDAPAAFTFRAAIGAVALLAGLAACLGILQRVPAATATVAALAAGLTGLASWSVFRLVSRRENIVCLALPFLPVFLGETTTPARAAGLPLLFIPIAAFIGLLLRRPDAAEPLEVAPEPQVGPDADDPDEPRFHVP